MNTRRKIVYSLGILFYTLIIIQPTFNFSYNRSKTVQNEAIPISYIIFIYICATLMLIAIIIVGKKLISKVTNIKISSDAHDMYLFVQIIFSLISMIFWINNTSIYLQRMHITRSVMALGLSFLSIFYFILSIIVWKDGPSEFLLIIHFIACFIWGTGWEFINEEYFINFNYPIMLSLSSSFVVLTIIALFLSGIVYLLSSIVEIIFFPITLINAIRKNNRNEFLSNRRQTAKYSYSSNFQQQQLNFERKQREELQRTKDREKREELRKTEFQKMVERQRSETQRRLEKQRLQEQKRLEKQRLEAQRRLEEQKRMEIIRREKEEEEILKKIEKMMRVSTKIRLDMMRDTLKVNESDFNTRIFDWAEKFGFKIDGDFIIVENADVQGFIKDLDNQFKIWKDKENSKV